MMIPFLNKHYQRHHKSTCVFLAISRFWKLLQEKRDFIKRAHCETVDHIFGDVAELVQGRGYCDIHGKQCSLPKCDILISGPACTSISGERTSAAEFANCYTDGSGASGLTYQSGYKDMIKNTGSTLSLFENVLKVANRTWPWNVGGGSLVRLCMICIYYIFTPCSFLKLLRLKELQ